MGVKINFGRRFRAFYPFEETNEIELTYKVYPYLSSVFADLGLDKICGIIGGGEQIASLSYKHAKEVLGIDLNLLQVALFYFKLFPEEEEKIESTLFRPEVLTLVEDDLKSLYDGKLQVASLRKTIREIGKISQQRLKYRGEWKDYLSDLARRVKSNDCNLELLVSDLFDVDPEVVENYDVLYLSSICEVKESRNKKARKWCEKVEKFIKKGEIVLIEASLYPTTKPIFEEFGELEYVVVGFPEDYRGMLETAYLFGNENILENVREIRYRLKEPVIEVKTS